MSRRAKKQQTDRAPKPQTDRAPVSGTRTSKARGRQRKQQRQKSKSALVVVPSQAFNSAPPASVAAPAGSAEVALAAAPASWHLPVATPAAASRLADEALADVELSFFEGGSSPVSVASDALAEPPQLVADEVDSVLLTPEQQQRRQWFRRQVMTLMAGMSAFGTAAVVVRIASLL
jgi:hypothetical protein